MKVEGKLFAPPATDEKVLQLRAELPAETPGDYFDFLRAADGGEIWFDVDSPQGFDCIRFYSTKEMLQFRPTYQELLPTLLVIGGDQGSQLLAYDISSRSPWPIVMFLPGWGAEHVAYNFNELRWRFIREIGETIPEEAEQ